MPDDGPERSRTVGHRAHTFASDNWAGVHPEVLEAVARANDGSHAPAYGADPWTAEAQRLLGRALRRRTPRSTSAFNGTGTNVVGLQSLLRPFEAVVCADSRPHQRRRVRCPGALPRAASSSPWPHRTGSSHRSWWPRVTGIGDEHHVQARVVSITQSTEVGTVYTVDEIAALAEWAHAHGMLVHLDGARIANAAAVARRGLRCVRPGGRRRRGLLRRHQERGPRCRGGHHLPGRGRRRRCGSSASSRCSCRRRCGSSPPSSWPC